MNRKFPVSGDGFLKGISRAWVVVWLFIATAGLPVFAEEHVHGPGYHPVEQSTELAVACPVMPRRQANGKYHSVYQGRTYYFCCSDCQDDFEENPGQYVKNGTTNTTLLRAEQTLSNLTHFIKPNQFLLYGLLVALGGVLVGKSRGLDLRRAPVLLILLGTVPLLSGLVAQLIRERTERHNTERELLDMRAREYFNYAVVHDFGDPPVPSKPPLPPRLHGTYYRGNDERTSKLWNNGNYRTSTFELRVLSGQGVALDHGIGAAPGPLRMVMDIVRAPFTAEEFWSPAVMDTIFLTSHANPIDTPASLADRVKLTTVERRQRFSASYPIGVSKGQGREHFSGVVYIGETMSYSGIDGVRFHLAIQYDITLQDGVALPDSDLWMGALYRTRRVPPWQLPLSEWFSHQPIPELPGPHATKDATALGLSDYQQKIEADRKAVPQ